MGLRKMNNNTNIGKTWGKSTAEAGSQSSAGNMLGTEWQQRAKEVLIAMGSLAEFTVEDISQDDLREVCANAARSRRMREESSSIMQEREEGPAATGRRLVWDEVRKW